MAKVNVYVQGNRVTVTAECRVKETLALTNPSTVKCEIRNLVDDGLLTFTWDGAIFTLPLLVNAEMSNPSVGIFKISFDVDAHGERLVYFAGTGACKTAGKSRFVVTRSDVE